MILAGLCAAAATFGLAFWSVGIPQMMLCFFLMGFFGYGTFPVITGALPYESVPLHLTGSALGFIVFIGEIIGGSAAPAIGGIIADARGLHMTMAAGGLSMLLAALFCLGLKETAPKVLARREAVGASVGPVAPAL